MDELIAGEKRVDRYIKENKKDLAVETLFDLIVRHAEAKRFGKAEALRQKLFEIDDTAVNQIVRAGEIIEAEKISDIDPLYRDTWSQLYKQLTAEESIALYEEMQAAAFEPRQTIFQQGEMNSNLYFVNEGQLKMFYRKGKRNILLKNLGPGEMAGEDTFFSNCICTVSLMTHSRVSVNFLDKTVLKKWQSTVPSLAGKLRDFCLEVEPIGGLIRRSELERREHRRHALSTAATVQITGLPDARSCKVEIADISATGASFIVNFSAKSAEVLLGCRVNVKFSLPQRRSDLRIELNGTIVGVHSQMFNEYLVNVRLRQPLATDMMDRIALCIHKR
jgi:CRP-like cAMP-binding protein